MPTRTTLLTISITSPLKGGRVSYLLIEEQTAGIVPEEVEKSLRPLADKHKRAYRAM